MITFTRDILTDIILFPIQIDVGLPVCLMINICPVVTSSVPNIDILLSWGWVTANSLWNTYNNPTGPTACVLVAHMVDACSLKCGNCWKNDVMSRGASSKGTPLINKTILRKIEQIKHTITRLPILIAIMLTSPLKIFPWVLLICHYFHYFLSFDEFEQLERI